MADEVPAEVYSAAARAIHDRECAEGSMCTATPTSMTRYAELGRVAADATWPLAYAAGRASARADVLKAAAGFYDKRALDLHAVRTNDVLFNLGQQMEAFNAARRQETVADELRCMAAGLDPDEVDVTEAAARIAEGGAR